MKCVSWLVIALALSGCSSVSQLTQQFPSIGIPSFQNQGSRLATQSATLSQMEGQVVQRINAIRQQQELSQLRPNETLARVARNYSKQMAEKNFFSHTSPSGDTMVQRVRSAGIFYIMLGENLFTCTNVSQPVPASIQGWMNSPGHRANILKSEYRETGVGVWRRGNTYYFTQLFMRSL